MTEMDHNLLLDRQVREALSSVPPQMSWDPKTMREAGEKLLATPVGMPSAVTRRILHISRGNHHGPVTSELEIRLFIPEAPRKAILLSIHGGGFVAGQAAYDDGWNSCIAQATGVTVASPNYRLAPEHPHPAALRDCQAAWSWLLDQFPGHRRLIYGDSAGGNLAAALGLWCREREGLEPDGILLIEPVLDDRLETPSMLNGVDTPVWDHANAVASWDAYLGDAPAGALAAPAREQDLSCFAPTFLLANQCDPLRDEDLEFARRLTEANVPTEAVLLPGTCHGILGLEGPPVAQRAREIVLSAIAARAVEE